MEPVLDDIDFEDEGIEKISDPIKRILTEPKKVFRYLFEYKPTKHVLLFAFCYGLINSSAQLRSYRMGTDIIEGTGFFLGLAFFGLIAAIVTLYVIAPIFKWSGTILGGTATYMQVRCVTSWACVPYLPLIIIEFLLFILVYSTISFQIISLIYLVYGLLALVMSVWSMIIYFIGFAEANKFSIGKAILAVLIGFAVILLVIVFTVLLFYPEFFY